MDVRSDVGQLFENWHNNELNEASLTSSDVSSCSIAHHRDVKTLSLFHISLIEELIEQQVSPLSAQFKWSQWGTDIAGVESHTWNELLADLDSLWGGGIDQQLSVRVCSDAEFVEMILELVSQLFHSGHISE
jgi:hypothetical protein